MKSIFRNILMTKRKAEPIFMVSGLPRCGTSMMMQMLEAGGMQVITDHIRQADEDNPHGYYEFEKVKKIKEDSSWLDGCHGKVFKMVSALLYYLPNSKKYKIVFMKRKMDEMLASQNTMLRRQGRNDAVVSDEEMAKKLDKHLLKVETWLAKQRNFKAIYINYNSVIENALENAKNVALFLNLPMDIDKMVKVVESSLYRQKTGNI
ncbi:MAG TPA: sulfotransferase family protein [Desulfobacterales bacterium]|nr:sulfotransferase family protein [Desulfobacterales bacterium]